MSKRDVPRLLQAGSITGFSLQRTESFVGLIGACWTGVIATVVLVTIWSRLPDVAAYKTLGAAVIVFLVVVESTMFAASWRAFQSDETFAVAAARLCYRWPRPVRPIVATWWLCHFLWSVAGAIVVEYNHATHLQPATSSHDDIPLGMLLFVAFIGCFVGNVFLCFAVAAITHRPRWVERVWACRFLVDFAASFLALLFVRWHG